LERLSATGTGNIRKKTENVKNPQKVNKLQNEKNVGNGKRFNGRTFSILHLKGGYTLSNIPISSMVLMQVLSDCGIVKYSGTKEQ
jgi:hypothetical protein